MDVPLDVHHVLVDVVRDVLVDVVLHVRIHVVETVQVAVQVAALGVLLTVQDHAGPIVVVDV